MKPEGGVSEIKFVIMHETWIKGLVRDVVTFVMIVSVIGTGWWLGSAAMQWTGFVMLCFIAITVATGRRNRLTPQEAADMLWREYRVKPDA